MTVLNIVGSTAVARVQSLIVKVVLAILTLFAIVTIANLEPGLLDPAGYPALQHIISSVALTFFAFLGFGVITFTAKDLPNPKRQLPRAMYLALAIATTVYVAVSLGVFGTLTADQVVEYGADRARRGREADPRSGRLRAHGDHGTVLDDRRGQCQPVPGDRA